MNITSYWTSWNCRMIHLLSFLRPLNAQKLQFEKKFLTNILWPTQKNIFIKEVNNYFTNMSTFVEIFKVKIFYCMSHLTYDIMNKFQTIINIYRYYISIIYIKTKCTTLNFIWITLFLHLWSIIFRLQSIPEAIKRIKVKRYLRNLCKFYF